MRFNFAGFARYRSFCVWAAVAAIIGCGRCPAAENSPLAEAIALRDQGEFEKAAALLQAAADQTSPPLSADEKRSMEFEIERIRRIRFDYQLTRETLLEHLKSRLNGVTGEELDLFEREGKFDAQ